MCFPYWRPTGIETILGLNNINDLHSCQPEYKQLRSFSLGKVYLICLSKLYNLDNSIKDFTFILQVFSSNLVFFKKCSCCVIIAPISYKILTSHTLVKGCFVLSSPAITCVWKFPKHMIQWNICLFSLNVNHFMGRVVGRHLLQ